MALTNLGTALPAFAEESPATPETAAADSAETAETAENAPDLAQITENLYAVLLVCSIATILPFLWMDQFRKARIPMAVAVIDMDWHLRDINPKYGKGWTGFTWNRKLFKDPAAFLGALHDRNLKTTLNVHPAEGIQPHEEMYEQASRDLDRDPSLEQPILFDFCDPEFIKVYFKDVIHPLKAQGVDFRWLDWQQGTISRTPHILVIPAVDLWIGWVQTMSGRMFFLEYTRIMPAPTKFPCVMQMH